MPTLSYGPNLGLLVHGNSGDEHYLALMAMFRGIDLLVQCSVLSRVLATPPAAPADGAAYIVAAAPTGAWVGNAGKLARWSAVRSAWEFFTPKDGWRAYVVDESQLVTYASGAWAAPVASAPMRMAVNNQAGTAYTLALADANGRVTRMTAASAAVVTVPTNATVAFDVGAVIPLRAVGAGGITVTGAGGVTINTPSGYLAASGRQGSSLMLHKVDVNEWDITGDLRAA